MVDAYYRIAPALVSLLNDQTVSAFVWRDISDAVLQIERGEFEGAVRTYRKMVEQLSTMKG